MLGVFVISNMNIFYFGCGRQGVLMTFCIFVTIISRNDVDLYVDNTHLGELYDIEL